MIFVWINKKKNIFLHKKSVMPKTLVNIITEDNPIPAYLFIKEKYEEGDKLMYISAKDTEDDLDALSEMFSVPKNHIQEIVLRHNTDEFTYEKICRTIVGYLNYDTQYCVNLAGGTRYMALAVQQVFERFHTEFFYVQVEENMIVKSVFDNRINNNDDFFYPISYRMNITEYLDAHEINHDLAPYTHKPIRFKEEAEYIFNLFILNGLSDQDYETLELLRTYYRNMRKAKYFKIKVLQNTGYSGYPPVPGLTDLLNIFNFNSARVGELSKREVEYLTGGWFEEYVYYLIKKRVKPQDIALGVRIWRKNVKHDNELDVVFTKGNKLFVIECKTGVQTKLFNEVVYKLCAISEALLGVSCCSYIFSLRPDYTDILKKVAKNMDITFIDRGILTAQKKLRKELAYIYVESRDGINSLLKNPTKLY